MKQILYITFVLNSLFLHGQCTLPFFDLLTNESKKVHTDKIMTGKCAGNYPDLDPGNYDTSFFLELFQENDPNKSDTLITKKVRNFILSNCGSAVLKDTKISSVQKTYIDSVKKCFPKIADYLRLEVKYLYQCELTLEPSVIFYFSVAVNDRDSIISPPPFYIDKDKKQPISICDAFENIKKQFPDKSGLDIEDICIYNTNTKKSYLMFTLSNMREKRMNYSGYKYMTYSYLVDYETGKCTFKEERESEIVRN